MEPSTRAGTHPGAVHQQEPARNVGLLPARGFSWGMTTDQMRQRDKNSTCATGTQLYWVENNCRLLPDAETYSDGGKLE